MIEELFYFVAFPLLLVVLLMLVLEHVWSVLLVFVFGVAGYLGFGSMSPVVSILCGFVAVLLFVLGVVRR